VLVALDECPPVTHNVTFHNLVYVYDMIWAIWINDEMTDCARRYQF
jgi:hypothetical protein